jgi:hypothetical protein
MLFSAREHLASHWLDLAEGRLHLDRLYGNWVGADGKAQAVRAHAMQMCGCANTCGVHGHDHACAWSGRLPVSDLKSFWGALGCACWAV